jgi:hypothetical protein
MIWTESIQGRLISVTPRPHRLLTLRGDLSPPAGFQVCQNSRQVFLKHYTRFWRYKKNQHVGFAYISYSHDEIFLCHDGISTGRGHDEIDGPDEFIYDAFNSLSPDLDKIQFLAIDIAFLTPQTFLLLNMKVKMYTLIHTELTGLRKLRFVTATPCSKNVSLLRDLNDGSLLHLIEALHKDVSEKYEVLPENNGYQKDIGELRCGLDLRPACPWGLSMAEAKDVPNAQEWQILPRDVGKWDLSQLAENAARYWVTADDSVEHTERSRWLTRHNPTLEVVDWLRSFVI